MGLPLRTTIIYARTIAMPIVNHVSYETGWTHGSIPTIYDVSNTVGVDLCVNPFMCHPLCTSFYISLLETGFHKKPVAKYNSNAISFPT